MRKQGKTYLCLNRILLGSDKDVLLQENLIVPPSNLLRLDGLADKCLLALTVPLSVAVHSVKIAKEFGLNSDEYILLFGTEKISPFISLVLKKWIKPLSITVIGLDKYFKARFPIFRENGMTTYSFNPFFRKEVGKLDFYYFKRIYQIVFEVSGSEEWMRAALNSLESGGSLMSVGLAESDLKLDINCIVRKELKLIGSDGYIKSDLENAISLISGGLVKGEWIKVIGPKKCKEAF